MKHAGLKERDQSRSTALWIRRRAVLWSPVLWRIALVLSAAALTGALALPVFAADRPTDSGIDRSMDFENPAQPLPRAILAFSRVTDIQVLYDSRDAERVNCNPVHGRMSGDQALRELQALPDAVLAEWRRKGWLALAHAHLMSLQRWRDLLGRRAAGEPAPALQPAEA